MSKSRGKTVCIETATAALQGKLRIPANARGVVIVADEGAGSPLSVRAQMIAGCLEAVGFGTLLVDLLTTREHEDAARRFDLELLTHRLIGATLWLTQQPEAARLPIGLFGGGTASAAALRTAAELAPLIRAVVSRAGRPDLASAVLPQIHAPTLIIVDSEEADILARDRAALLGLLRDTCSELAIVPDSIQLFDEPAALAHVTELATEWFESRLWRAPTRPLVWRYTPAHA